MNNLKVNKEQYEQIVKWAEKCKGMDDSKILQNLYDYVLSDKSWPDIKPELSFLLVSLKVFGDFLEMVEKEEKK